MTTVSPPALPAPKPLPSFDLDAGRVAVAVALVGIGDWLFWGERPGLSIPAFAAAIAFAVALLHPARATGGRLAGALVLLVLGCLPGVEAAGPLQTAFAFCGLAAAALLLARPDVAPRRREPLDAVRLLASGPARLVDDARALLGPGGKMGRAAFTTTRLAGWVVPVGLALVFVSLLADANPILARWVAALDPIVLLDRLDGSRGLAWAFLLLLVRPFVHVRLRTAAGGRPASAAPSPPLADTGPSGSSLAALLLGREAVGRSLVLFNALFAVQTALDLAFLWGGAELPPGVTYASYAHRGAYPLIATALLAAAFVLVAMRPGGPAEGARPLRLLVYAFVAQNAGLVVSSILRLDLYVSVYSLTYWRVAAFAWMGLVLVGLVLIAVRIALGRSNLWLVRANLAALGATLYLGCFVNVAALVAEFNLAHQAREPGSRLDLGYLSGLGPDAIPAIDRALADDRVLRRPELAAIRARLAAHHRPAVDWREWDVRTARLSAYLAGPVAPLEQALPASPAAPAIEPAPAGR